MDDKTAPPDDLDYRNPPGTRVTYQARQRATDRTTWLHLALHLPAFLLSLALVLAAALVLEAWLGVPAWLPTALWTASGALTFHRPSEQFLARHLLRLHRPLPADLATLTPVWHEVTARAGVDGRQYELWIEESSDLNALAAASTISSRSPGGHWSNCPPPSWPPYSPTNWATTWAVMPGPGCSAGGTACPADSPGEDSPEQRPGSCAPRAALGTPAPP